MSFRRYSPISRRWGYASEAPPQNKGMKLTKLSAAALRGKKDCLMPAPTGLDAGTASQLVPGVGWT